VHSRHYDLSRAATMPVCFLYLRNIDMVIEAFMRLTSLLSP
jgi:hypothetical protein